MKYPGETNRQIKRYLRSVEHRLYLPAKIRSSVMSDLITGIALRREHGESDEEILRTLQAPEQVAEEINEQMKEFAYRKSPWRFVFAAIVMVSILWLLFFVLVPLGFQLRTAKEAVSIGIIGGADGPTAMMVATSARNLLWEVLGCMAVAAVGIFGFVRLSRCKKK